MAVRNRVTEVLALPAHKILVNPDNPYTHPDFQRGAVRGLLDEVGIVDRLLAYRSERAGGELVLLDGQLRSELEPNAEWTVLVLDITDKEADLLLLSLNRTTQLSDFDKKKVAALMERVRVESQGVKDFLADMGRQVGVLMEQVAQEQTAFLNRFLAGGDGGKEGSPTENFDNPYVSLAFPATTEQRDYVFGVLKAARSVFGVVSSTEALVKILESWHGNNFQEA